ncbi:MAG TPA: T9SS type A sorting domain-containing protein [Bacteroidia bacterium]|nr:T9SS type A sorting domain-containing protein [Bacteroidia bacterium]HRH07954.1 T9SS type A sorting domain-containing protein [Bacteroidia bacterium]
MKNLLSIILSALPSLIFAQSTERSVIASNGGYGSTVSFTIGEVVVASGSPSIVTLYQGFQQPDPSSIGIMDITKDLSIKAFPNPTKGLVTLELSTLNDLALTISVFDASGKLTILPVTELNLKGEATHSIDFSNLEAGNYYVQIQNIEGTLNRSLKIQKVK